MIFTSAKFLIIFVSDFPWWQSQKVWFGGTKLFINLKNMITLNQQLSIDDGKKKNVLP